MSTEPAEAGSNTTPPTISSTEGTRDDAPLTLAAVDDHPYVLKGILWTLEKSAPWITVLATAGSVAELIAAGGEAADVVLLDLDLGAQSSDVEADPTINVQTLRAAGPQVLILTAEHQTHPHTSGNRSRRHRPDPQIRP